MTSTPPPAPSATQPTIRAATPTDAAAIARIYNHYITHTIVTFEETPLEAATLVERLHEVTAAGFPWLVADTDAGVMGYAYATLWRSRSAYRFSAESTVYLDHSVTRRGTGSLLYTRLLDRLALRGAHTVIGGIALPNEGSVALHEKFGFRKVAHMPEVGFKFERWVDVGYWLRQV